MFVYINVQYLQNVALYLCVKINYGYNIVKFDVFL